MIPGKEMIRPAATAARMVTGVVLAAAGFLKLLSPPEELAMALESYRLIPAAMTLPAARGLPWAELFLGLCLLFGLWARVALPASAVLVGAFLFTLASSLWRGLALADCGCFGRWIQLSPRQTLLMDVVLLLLLCVAALGEYGKSGPDRRPE